MVLHAGDGEPPGEAAAPAVFDHVARALHAGGLNLFRAKRFPSLGKKMCYTLSRPKALATTDE